MYNKILVPLDGSATAEKVLPHVRALAQCTGAEIVLLRVAVNPGAEFAFSDPSLAESLIREMEIEARKYMSGITLDLRSDGLNVTCLNRQGPIAETILDMADQAEVDVIAMSTHGRTGPARWLLGSIADKVVRGSSKPVILVRAS